MQEDIRKGPYIQSYFIISSKSTLRTVRVFKKDSECIFTQKEAVGISKCAKYTGLPQYTLITESPGYKDQWKCKNSS